MVLLIDVKEVANVLSTNISEETEKRRSWAILRGDGLRNLDFTKRMPLSRLSQGVQVGVHEDFQNIGGFSRIERK